MNYKEIIKDLSIDKLKIKSVTDKFVMENFDVTEEVRTEREKTAVKTITFDKMFMGQNMPISIYLGMLYNLIEGDEATHIQTVRDNRSPVPYLVTSKIVENVISERDYINGIKQEIKDSIKALS